MTTYRTATRRTFLALSVLLAQAGHAASSVITFDDVAFPGGNPLAASSPAVGYQGFDWGANWVISPNDATGWYGGTVQPYSHSGNNFAWNSGGGSYELAVRGGGTFDLTSFWARTWPSINATATARGFRNGVEVFSQTFSLTSAYALVTTNFIGIDRFTTSTQQFLIDDITVANVTAAVPEPATGALLAAGLAAVAAVGRRRNGRLDGSAAGVADPRLR